MRRLEPPRAVRLGVLLSVVAISTAARAENGPRAASLSWVRRPGAESCPGPAAVANAVESRLGARVLVPSSSPDLAVEAYVEPSPPIGYRVVLAVSDPEGHVIGHRELTSTEVDCTPIAESAELAIALMIDPEAHASAPSALSPVEPRAGTALPATSLVAPASTMPPESRVAPPPVALASPPRAEPADQKPVRESPWSGAVEGSVSFMVGLLPDVAPGVHVAARMPLYEGLFALAAGASYYPKKTQRTALPADGSVATNEFQAASVDLRGCFQPEAGKALVSGTACLGVDVGSMSVRTSGLDISTGGTSWIVDIDMRARVMFRPIRGWLIFVGGALRLALNRDELQVADAAGNGIKVTSRSVVGGEPEIGMGYEF